MEEGKAIFVDRAEETELVESLVEGLREGTPGNLCFSGPPGTGKTALLKRAIELHAEAWVEEGLIPVWVPLEDVGAVPVDLALRYVSRVAAAFLDAVGAKAEAARILVEDTFPDEARRLRSPAMESFTETMVRFMHTEGMPGDALLEAAFRFPERFATEKDLRFVLFLDDFPRLMRHRLDQGRAAVDLFEAVLADQAEVFYVVSIVPSPFADRYFVAEGAPFHKAFQYFPVEALPPAEAEAMARDILGTPGDPARRAARLSAGFPLYLSAVARAARRSGGEGAVTAEDVDRAFATQVLSPWGAIHLHFQRLLTDSLARKEDVEPAKAVVAALASGRRVSREEMEKVSGRAGKALGALLGRILSLGLFRKVDSHFYFDDPLFRYWAVSAQENPPESFTGKEAKGRAQSFLDRFLDRRKKTSMAQGKINFRHLVAALKGREVPGSWMGVSEPVRFPPFDKVQGFAFTSKDIKVYYLTAEDTGWFMLVLWRDVKVERSLVDIFARRALKRARKLWLVGRGGFSAAAKDCAQSLGIYTSSEDDLRKMMEDETS